MVEWIVPYKYNHNKCILITNYQFIIKAKRLKEKEKKIIFVKLCCVFCGLPTSRRIKIMSSYFVSRLVHGCFITKTQKTFIAFGKKKKRNNKNKRLNFIRM